MDISPDEKTLTESGSADSATASLEESNASKPKCGIVMPISDHPDYRPGHWQEVRRIIEKAVEDAFEPRLVSFADEVTVFQKTIVQNLYADPIVICDVSSKNPNVMFELGIRLTFDRPTVIIKDQSTNFIFDTGPIEHLIYPTDLRHEEVERFIVELGRKVRATYKAGQDDDKYSAFLKHFGQFVTPQLETKVISPERFLAQQIGELNADIKELKTVVGFIRSESRQHYYPAQMFPRTTPQRSTYIPLTTGLSLSEGAVQDMILNSTEGASALLRKRLVQAFAKEGLASDEYHTFDLEPNGEVRVSFSKPVSTQWLNQVLLGVFALVPSGYIDRIMYKGDSSTL